MNSKHLATDSPCPPARPPGSKPRLYSMRFCPYAERPLLVAAAKGIDLEIVNINLKQRPAWFFEKNSRGQVPALELPDHEECLSESLVVSDYLDEAYPGGASASLYPTDPYKKALDRVWIQRIALISDPHGVLSFSEGDTFKIKGAVQALKGGLSQFEEELQRRRKFKPGPYFANTNAPGMLDYMLWPFVERLAAHTIMYGEVRVGACPASGETVSLALALDERYPLLHAWRLAMKCDPAVKECKISAEHHAAYRKSGAGGRIPDYDMLLAN